MLITSFNIKGMNLVAQEIASRFKSGSVEVGFFGGDNITEAGVDYAIIAEKNNYGDPMNMLNGKSAPIPPRPFIEKTIDEFDAYVEENAQMRTGGQKWWEGLGTESIEHNMLSGNRFDRRLETKKLLNTLSAEFLSIMYQVCEGWTTPPNDAYTIAKKGRNDPLVWDKNLASYARSKNPVLK